MYTRLEPEQRRVKTELEDVPFEAMLKGSIQGIRFNQSGKVEMTTDGKLIFHLQGHVHYADTKILKEKGEAALYTYFIKIKQLDKKVLEYRKDTVRRLVAEVQNLRAQLDRNWIKENSQLKKQNMELEAQARIANSANDALRELFDDQIEAMRLTVKRADSVANFGSKANKKKDLTR